MLQEKDSGFSPRPGSKPEPRWVHLPAAWSHRNMWTCTRTTTWCGRWGPARTEPNRFGSVWSVIHTVTSGSVRGFQAFGNIWTLLAEPDRTESAPERFFKWAESSAVLPAAAAIGTGSGLPSHPNIKISVKQTNGVKFIYRFYFLKVSLNINNNKYNN